MKDPRFGVNFVCNMRVCRLLSERSVVAVYLPPKVYIAWWVLRLERLNITGIPTLTTAAVALIRSSGKARSSSTYLFDIITISVSFRSSLNMESLNWTRVPPKSTQVIKDKTERTVFEFLVISVNLIPYYIHPGLSGEPRGRTEAVQERRVQKVTETPPDELWRYYQSNSAQHEKCKRGG